MSQRGFMNRITTVLQRKLQGETGTRFKRFVLAAIVAVASSQATLTICLGVFHISPTRAGFIAWVAGATASYIMSRWTWERKGRPNLLKETLPFWIIAACVATILTLTTRFASDLAVSIGLSHASRVVFVDAAFFLVNCITFATRFFIFHYILFADRHKLPPKTTPA